MDNHEKTDHISTGIYSLLSVPIFYNILQQVIGSGHLERITMNNLRYKAGDRVLDLGCGTASILNFLPKEVTYDGYDFNPRYIEYAKKKFKNRGTFYCKRIKDLLSTNQKYQIVLASALIHHLNDEETMSLFNIAHHSLDEGGYLLTIDSVYCEGQSKLSKFFISYDRGRHVRTQEEYVCLAKNFFTKVDVQILEGWTRFIPYTLIVMKCYKNN